MLHLRHVAVSNSSAVELSNGTVRPSASSSTATAGGMQTTAFNDNSKFVEELSGRAPKRKVTVTSLVVKSPKIEFEATPATTNRKANMLVAGGTIGRSGVAVQQMRWRGDASDEDDDDDDEVKLLCAESLTSSRATDDRKRLTIDRRVLDELLVAENGQLLRSNPYKDSGCVSGRAPSSSPAIDEAMRNKLADWIFEICDRKSCDPGVFPSVMFLVDRVMSIARFRDRLSTTQFQLVAAVCLFVVSKLRDCSDETCLSAAQIVHFTDNAFSRSQLLEWELLILYALNWDVAVITPYDFVDVLLYRLPLDGDQTTINRVRHHTLTFIALCAHYVEFSLKPPSMVAAACLLAAINITLGNGFSRYSIVDQCIQQLIGTESDYIRACRELIERFAEERYAAGCRLLEDYKQGCKMTHDARLSLVTPTNVRDIELDKSCPRK